jgi:hypothetical protein
MTIIVQLLLFIVLLRFKNNIFFTKFQKMKNPIFGCILKLADLSE